jgi:translation initiation factor IF-3
VIAEDGEQLGVLPITEALRLAGEYELDLVEVSSKSDPPVCRLMDYGKFKYEQRKKAHEAKKKQMD